jgi:conjugative transposon TraN protein
MKEQSIKLAIFTFVICLTSFGSLAQKARKKTTNQTEKPKQESLELLPIIEPTSSSTGLLAVSEVKQIDQTTNEVKAVKLGQENQIMPILAELAYNKTTSFIFGSSIKSVDLGSKSIIADKAANIENVLNVKAAQIGFNETNFSVITNDGKFYSFVCIYNEFPTSMAYNLTSYNNNANSMGKVDITLNQEYGDKMNEIVENINRVSRKMNRTLMDASMYDIGLKITGLFVKDNTYYIKTLISNKSFINYDIDFIGFTIVDQTILKNTASQEIELKALNNSQSPDVVNGRSQAEVVFAFNKFTLPNNKLLRVMLNETNGGRNLIIQLNSDLILKAKKL